MKIEEFNFPSADKRTEIHCCRYVPDIPITAVLQISHGMVEHIERYEDFAREMTKRGILVTGNDHLGHGRSIAEPEDLWHFPVGGNRILLKDIHTLRQMTARRYPNVPYFMLGHSMGSFLLRQYLCIEGEGLAGALVIGTGDQPSVALIAGSIIAKVKCRIQGETHHSRLLTAMALGSNNKRFIDGTTGFEWLSRDPVVVNAYVEDEKCGGMFTNRAFFEMFKGMRFLKKKDNWKRMPKTLPVIILSGEEDPVGSYGKAVHKVANKFQSAGMIDVTCRLYPGARHEILNETNKEEVYQDIISWIEPRIDKISE
ncbi:MAG: alpha/beta fold hydrolase [Clostridiales bacterium]|nr:alpha/beta fold hydrolase [Clostridiales bacterium]